MGYDFKITKSGTLKLCISSRDHKVDKEIEIEVTKGQEFDYEFYCKPGDLEYR